MHDWAIPNREAELLASAQQDLPVLELADDVTHLLVKVAQQINIDARDTDPRPAQLRLHALWFMAIIALRASRAAMHALSVGYEDQAVGYQRLIDELHNRTQKVRADASGEYARHWLAGRGLDKGAKLAGQDFWEFLSGPVHANARAVLDWLAISQEDGSTKIVLGPERRPEVANAALAYIAGEGRDIASMLALEAGVTLDLRDLDRRIHDAHAQYVPNADDGPGTPDDSPAPP